MSLPWPDSERARIYAPLSDMLRLALDGDNDGWPCLTPHSSIRCLSISEKDTDVLDADVLHGGDTCAAGS